MSVDTRKCEKGTTEAETIKNKSSSKYSALRWSLTVAPAHDASKENLKQSKLCKNTPLTIKRSKSRKIDE